jgi:SAM-dependent methyltransferase
MDTPEPAATAAPGDDQAAARRAEAEAMRLARRAEAEAQRAARLAAAAARRPPKPPEPPPAPPRWEELPAGPEDARACYRLLLGREPEDEEVLDRHVIAAPTLGQLRDRFLGTAEFRRIALPPEAPEPPDAGPPPDVEAVVTAAEEDQLFLRQLRVWTQLGEQAPHWSNLAEDAYRPESFPANRRRFHASGAVDATALVALLARHGLTPEQLPRLLEHGCGTGRVTLHLAQHFTAVEGMDISAPHLALARAEAQARGMVHLRWLRCRGDQPMPAEGYDVWYSRRTLQWNPPPLIRRILELAFAGLAPGGVAVFQLPTWYPGYRFRAAEHLASPAPAAPELHLLPQGEVFALAAAAGLRVLEVREDTHLPVAIPSALKSQLFVLRKPG